MKIQQKKGNVYLQTANAKVIIGNEIKAKSDEADIFIGKTVTLDGNDTPLMVIDRPGEYEANGVMVQAISEGGSANILLFSVDVEDINVVFITDVQKPVSNKVIDQIGVNNVLLVHVDKEIEHIRDLVEEIDPNIIVPLVSDAELQSSIAKKIGVALPISEKTINVTSEDFDSDEEEKPLQLVILD